LTLTNEDKDALGGMGQNDVFGEILEIAAGCVCCSVRSDFLLAIDTLLAKRHFDYVVLECSGIADVGNLINSLWADRALGSSAVLDAVVCLVDVEELLLQLFHEPTASPTASPSLSLGSINNASPPQPLLNPSLNILKNQLVYSDVAIINKMENVFLIAFHLSIPTLLLTLLPQHQLMANQQHLQHTHLCQHVATSITTAQVLMIPHQRQQPNSPRFSTTSILTHHLEQHNHHRV
jgi:G3E family GTPase